MEDPDDSGVELLMAWGKVTGRVSQGNSLTAPTAQQTPSGRRETERLPPMTSPSRPPPDAAHVGSTTCASSWRMRCPPAVAPESAVLGWAVLGK